MHFSLDNTRHFWTYYFHVPLYNYTLLVSPVQCVYYMYYYDWFQEKQADYQYLAFEFTDCSLYDVSSATYP